MRADSIRLGATYSWVLGLALLSTDFFSFQIVERPVSLTYGIFGLSFFLMALAEKKEFSSRVFLYRLHDVVIFSPWRYLFLALLWITLVSQVPIRGVLPTLQVGHLWVSFFCIGINAQFLFCDRSKGFVFLRPDRLALAFKAFAISLSLSFFVLLGQLFLPALSLPEPKQKSLFAFFLLGLPFLIWDGSRSSGRFLPRWLTFFLIVLGLGTVLLLGRKLYLLSSLAAVFLLLGVYLYKKVRPRNWWRPAIGAVLGAVLFSIFLRHFLFYFDLYLEEFRELRSSLEREAIGTMLSTWKAWQESQWFGGGLGGGERRGLWARVISDSGLVGLGLYGFFFGSLLYGLYTVRRVPRVSVSHAGLCSLLVFLLFLSFYLDNPADGYLWVWYGLWALFASTPRKRKMG